MEDLNVSVKLIEYAGKYASSEVYVSDELEGCGPPIPIGKDRLLISRELWNELVKALGEEPDDK